MYPLNAAAPFPREQWYVAGTREEFCRTITARQILGDPLVFYRTESGKPVAMWGLCPHRLMPFELGQLKGDDVVCGYHGFTFASNGNCVSIPANSGISSGCRVKSYPVIERGPWVWIWMGEGPADLALLPDASDIGLGQEPGEWRADVTKTFLLKARVQLLIDNLMDLSHLAFIHAQSVAGGDKIALAEAVVEDADGHLIVRRTLADVPPTADPFIGYLLPGFEGNVWSELLTDVYNPCLLNAAGPWLWRSNEDGSRGKPLLKLNFIHAMTPANPHETHYFGVVSRNFRQDDEALSVMLVEGNDRVRLEDVAALEAIEKVVDRYGDVSKEISIKPDQGGIMMRRRLRKLIDSEAAAGASA